MSRTAEEWGRIAVSLPGWRWMPGMLDTAGDRLGEVTLHDGVRAVTAPPWWTYGWRERLPDPDDPATAGCLLALLGAEVVVYAPRGLDDFDPDWVINYRVDTHTTITGRGLSLGRACIAAAEALGRWPGGGTE